MWQESALPLTQRALVDNVEHASGAPDLQAKGERLRSINQLLGATGRD